MIGCEFWGHHLGKGVWWKELAVTKHEDLPIITPCVKDQISETINPGLIEPRE